MMLEIKGDKQKMVWRG